MKRNLLNTLLHRILLLAAIICALFAILITSAKLITPRLNLYKTKIEALASEALTQPVQIKAITAKWDMLSPVLQFEEVKVLDDNRSRTLMNVNHLGLRISILQSLIKQKISIDKLFISGANLTIMENADQHFTISGTEALEKQFNDTAASTFDSIRELTDWLFAQYDVIIDNCNIHFIRHAGHPITLTDLTLHLKNNGSTHHLTVQSAISQKLPTSILIDAYMHGNLQEPDKFKANLFIRLTDLSLVQWLNDIYYQDYTIKSGMLNTSIWAQWSHQQWQKAQAELQLQNLKLTKLNQPSIKINSLSTNIDLNKITDTKWQIKFDKLRLDLQNKNLGPNQVDLIIDYPLTGIQTIEQLRIAHIDQEMLAFAKSFLSNDQQIKFKKLHFHGTLTEVIYKRLTQINDYFISAKLHNIGFSRWQKIPGIQNLTGSLTMTANAGNLIIKSHDASLDFGKLFRNPIKLTTLDGRLSWFKQNQSWIVKAEQLKAVNTDLHVHGNCLLEIPTDDSGIKINLLAGYDLMNVKNKSLYLPSGILSKGLIKWLDDSIIDGRSGNGGLVLRGNLKDFPFSNNTGKFLVLSQVHGVTLAYRDNWPILTDLNAILKFDADTMTITASSGNIYSSKIESVTANIPQLSAKETVLDIYGRITGNLADGIKFIQSSPLAETFGKIKHLELDGQQHLDLTLHIPLDTAEPVNITGTTTFAKTQLHLPEWNITLPLSNGNLSFTENSLNSSLLSSELFNKPITLQLAKKPQDNQTTITVNGSAEISHFIKQPPFNQWLKGNMAYQAQLFLSNDPSGYDSLKITSDLAGVELNLPAPFNKPADTKTVFSSEIALTGNEQFPVQFQFAGLLNGKLLLQQSQQNWSLARGIINIGGGKVDTLAATSGLVLKGYLAKFDKKAWQPYIDELLTLNKTVPISHPLLSQINLKIGKIALDHSQFDNTDLSVQVLKDQWEVSVNNEILQGRFTIPKRSHQPWNINLAYLHLPEKDDGPTPVIDIADIPAMNFYCTDFKHGKKNLGNVSFMLSPLNSNAMQIGNLKVASAHLQLTAAGIWEQRNKQHFTHLKGSIISNNLGQALRDLDLPASITSKNAQLNFDFNYPALPYDPSLKLLRGKLRLMLRNGQLLDLSKDNSTKIGFGQLLTFLSVQNITRRLQLDFSDLTQGGFAFDKLSGQLRFLGGDAYTKHLKIESSIARINIRGKIGLAAKNYDLELAITPHLTSSLPVIATIAGGPVVGAVTWAADRLLTTQAKKNVQYGYKMTGPWSKPVIEPITTAAQGNN